MSLLDRAVNIVDKITAFPGKVRDFSEDVNDRLIKIANDLQAATNMAGERAETNLVNTRVRQAGGDAFSFIQRNIVVIGLAVSAFVVFMIWRKV